MLQTIIYNSNQKVALLREIKYSGSTAQNLLNIYDEIETNQVFGASEVARILELSYSGARKVLGKLIDMNVLVAVKGKGKGKYRFLNGDEIK